MSILPNKKKSAKAKKPETREAVQPAHEHEPRTVRFRVGKHQYDFQPGVTVDTNELRKWLDDCGGTPVYELVLELDGLLDLTDEQRRPIFQAAQARSAVCVFHHDGEEVRAENLLEAVLSLLVGPEQPERCLMGQHAAMDAAALVHPMALGPACDKIAQRLRTLQVTGVKPDKLCKTAQNLAAYPNPFKIGGPAFTENRFGQKSVCDVLPKAPVSEEAVVPRGWTMATNGIARFLNFGLQGDVVIPAPVLITARFVEPTTGAEWLEIATFRDGKWIRRKVKRGEIADTRAIVGLANFGFPVTAINAKDLIQFLADYERDNASAIPIFTSTHHLGWQGENGEDGFLVGCEYISANGEVMTTGTADTPSDGLKEGCVVFTGGDVGDYQLAEAYGVQGSYEAWRTALAPFGRFPRVRLAIVASLSAPLLRQFETSNFVLDFCGETTSGKTTALQIAGSCWGNPDPSVPASTVLSWQGTGIYRERVACILHDVPTIIDDSKGVTWENEVSKAIYHFTAGRGRGRGSVTGIARIGTSRSVLITSGEGAATSFSQEGGTKARVATVWGSPFGVKDGEIARLIHERLPEIRRNFGHAGPRLVQYILQHKECWDDWQRRYSEERGRYEDRAETVPRRTAWRRSSRCC